MGQTYRLIILNDARRTAPSKDKIEKYFRCGFHGGGIGKMCEFSYIGNWGVNAFLTYLKTPKRVVCAGEYADIETKSNKNLYELCKSYGIEIKYDKVSSKVKKHTFRYIINESKKEYLDLTENLAIANSEDDLIFHPLPILISEGNGRGMGDYGGISIQYVGTWARDLIRVSGNKPSDKKYKKKTYIFFENFKSKKTL